MNPCSLTKRLLAISYDTLIVMCIVFIAWQPVPLIPEDLFHPKVLQMIRLSYLLFVCFVYFGWCWQRGQTLGMRAWRVHLVSRRGGKLSWLQAWNRFTCAIFSWLCLGAGFLWGIYDTNHRTWHDAFSDSDLVME